MMPCDDGKSNLECFLAWISVESGESGGDNTAIRVATIILTGRRQDLDFQFGECPVDEHGKSIFID